MSKRPLLWFVGIVGILVMATLIPGRPSLTEAQVYGGPAQPSGPTAEVQPLTPAPSAPQPTPVTTPSPAPAPSPTPTVEVEPLTPAPAEAPAEAPAAPVEAVATVPAVLPRLPHAGTGGTVGEFNPWVLDRNAVGAWVVLAAATAAGAAAVRGSRARRRRTVR